MPIGLAATILAVRRLIDSRGPATRLDLPGAALVSGGAIGIVWSLVRANDVGWSSAEIISALVVGTVLMAAFVAWERHVHEPMLAMRLFRNRSFAAANATGFLMTGGLMAGAFVISQYLQVALGYSPLSAGLHFLPMTATPLLVAPAAGALADRIGPRPVLVSGMLLLGGGLAWLAQVASGVSGYQQLLLPLLVAGIGASMVLPTTATAALSAVPFTELGKASGATSTLQRFGGVFGIASTTAVFGANGHLASGSINEGFKHALALAAGLSLLGAISAWRSRPGGVWPRTQSGRRLCSPSRRWLRRRGSTAER
ncbi:MAG: MFS transporter [Candidatus Dormibacteraeota bacterium]|uniref:MFS transporter n=1 Tax=Candidatus Dormiibacter inghamiae TaxID=3127013 RepID=A0A934KCG9_9BACT|nr:MFS transporter [Candidatus Dormibacteraeota bacterium]